MKKIFIYGLFSALLILLLSGCASTSRSQNENVPDGQAVTACPQCKSVLVQPAETYYMQWAEEGYQEPAYQKHVCPGCQGAITTLFKEGKFEHKCSVCETGPYSCELFELKNVTSVER